MSMLYLTGKYANVCNRVSLGGYDATPAGANGSVTVTPSAASAYPIDNVCDRDPSTPTILGSLVSNSHFDLFHSALANRSFDAAFSPSSDWTDASAGTGTAARTTDPTKYNTGTGGALLTSNGSGNEAEMAQRITVVAGEHRRLIVYAKALSGVPVMTFTIYNPQTGHWWNGTTWTTVPSAVTPTGTVNGVSFTQLYADYQVEDYDTVFGDTTYLLIYVTNRSAAASELGVDDTADVPGINFCGVFGHNLGDITNPTLQHDITNGYVGLETSFAMTAARGSFFVNCTMSYSPYWRFVIGGTNWDEPYIGELVFGQVKTCATDPKAGPRRTLDLPSIGHMSPIGRLGVYPLASASRRSVGLTFQAKTAAAAREIAVIYERSQAGRYPVIIAPISTEADVYYGRLTAPHVEDRPIDKFWESSMDLIGDPLPLVGA